MKRRHWILILLLLSATGLSAKPAPSVSVKKLNGTLYEITAHGEYDVNLLASIGSDGLLLVDTGLPETGDALVEALAKLGAGQPRIIINTHHHIDHTGNNGRFKSRPVIIGHTNLAQRLESGCIAFYFDGQTAGARLNVKFEDTLTLSFNGEEILLFSVPGAHSDNDIGVLFTKSGVAYLGDLAYGMYFPSYDRISGNPLLYGERVKRALDRLPEGTLVVSGHGRDCTTSEMREFQEMLTGSVGTVRTALESGRTVAQMTEQKLLARWEPYAGGGTGMTTEDWAGIIASSVQNGPPKRESLCPPLHAAYVAKGIDGLIARYAELKATQRETYLFAPQVLGNVSVLLGKGGKTGDAVGVALFATREFPDSGTSWYFLGESYLRSGDRAQAIEALEKSIALSPDDPGIAALLEEARIGG